MTARVSARAAAHLLWHFGYEGGCEPGSFVAALLELVDKADEENRERLGSLWPEYVAGHAVAQREPWGIEWLRAIVEADRVGGGSVAS